MFPIATDKVFSHGWPLNADAWDEQLYFLASHGYRAIAHDRRGHGRSSQPWNGNDMDTYADDLAAVLDKLDVRDAICSRSSRASVAGPTLNVSRSLDETGGDPPSGTAGHATSVSWSSPARTRWMRATSADSKYGSPQCSHTHAGSASQCT
jgi:hypothetical protein